MRLSFGVIGLCALGMLSGCATQNEPTAYAEDRFDRIEVTAQLVRIRSFSNFRTRQDDLKKHALFRAAEFAKSRNKPWFLIYSNLPAAARATPTQEVLTPWIGGERTAATFVQPLDQAQPGAFETDSVLKERDAFLASRHDAATKHNK